MLSTGVDIIEIDRIERALKRHHGRFELRVYTAEEIRFCRGRVEEFAVRFAAKEAVMKALGTGVRGIGWREIEILPDKRGKPLVYLYERAAARAAYLGLTEFAISLTHGLNSAIAFVVAAGPDRLDFRR